jgi:hypothetical protein
MWQPKLDKRTHVSWPPLHPTAAAHLPAERGPHPRLFLASAHRRISAPKIQLRPRRAPRAFATFRLATIYLPHFLMLKWVVVKYSGVPLPVAGGTSCLSNLRASSRRNSCHRRRHPIATGVNDVEMPLKCQPYTFPSTFLGRPNTPCGLPPLYGPE